MHIKNRELCFVFHAHPAFHILNYGLQKMHFNITNIVFLVNFFSCLRIKISSRKVHTDNKSVL